MHEEKKISREVIFAGIEAAIKLAAERHFKIEEGAEGVAVNIDRSTGDIAAKKGEEDVDPVTLGRIAAAVGKASHDPEDREAESDTVFGEFSGKKGEMIQAPSRVSTQARRSSPSARTKPCCRAASRSRAKRTM